MAIQTETAPEVGVPSLIGGIVQDARKLLVEQLTLFQVEIKNDVRRTLTAVAPILGGLGVVLVGLVLLGIAGAYLLCWIAPSLPLWAGHAIVGGITAVVGGGLILWGKSMLETVSPTPDIAINELKETIRELKENINGKRTSNSTPHGENAGITY